LYQRVNSLMILSLCPFDFFGFYP